ncbi:protein kinase domain-containing protein [Nocardiopsis ansamitocini]|uniref:non-specific serine/threonine protein kinase n=1 Tax=Nocardiopsis ansamitocini TaxID=1670832 RepID=A0A9W6UHC8_9ACTN|nr:NPCBM/NEW2 domain-containing protein [Nocardiopsis ansamitocini]GLU45845.1 hypothetical protein Nans01_01960 [Nocardiopsis ansamitocini]
MSSALYVGPDSQPDKYRLVRSVGRGGDSTLYLAEAGDAGWVEPVVVKMLTTGFVTTAAQFAQLSNEWSEQAELLASVTRVGAVGVLDHFEGAVEHRADQAAEGGERALYLVMNHVSGMDLRDWRAEHAAEGPRGQREALRYLEQLAGVLDVLHSGRATPAKRAVVHGDLSPGNVMIDRDGQATLVDYGMGAIAARGLDGGPRPTEGYAAPETATGAYSPAADRYAFGAIAYFTLTGQEPPPGPERLRTVFSELPVLNGARPEERAAVLAVFSTDPAERPSVLQWIKRVRSLGTSTPWSTTEPPAADAPSTTPASSGAPRHITFGGPGPQRPVGGMRGTPAPRRPVPAPAPPSSPVRPVPQPRPLGDTTPMDPVPGSPAHTGERKKKKSRKPLLAWLAVLLLVAVGVGGVGAYTAFDRWNRNQPATSVEPNQQLAPVSSPPSSPSPSPSPTPEPSPSGPSDGPFDEERSLTELTPAATSPAALEWTTARMDDRTYNRSLTADLSCVGENWNDYDLARSWDVFEAVVGMGDLSAPTASAVFTVLVDGDERYAETVQSGDQTLVRIDVTDALRLRLGSEAGVDCDDAGLAVWGDPRLLG